MLKHLELENVGPAASMALGFGERLNVITGDNGLGKAFCSILCGGRMLANGLLKNGHASAVEIVDYH